MPSGWRSLSLDEALVVQAELIHLRNVHGSDGIVASLLGCSQQLVHVARAKGTPGRLVANALYEFLGVTREQLLAKYSELFPKVPVQGADDPVLGLPPDKFPTRAVAARRAVLSTQWTIAPSAVRYVCTAPEWQAPEFGQRDAVFWVEQMKLQTSEELRAMPRSEEDRLFRQALRDSKQRATKTVRAGKRPGKTASGRDQPAKSQRMTKAAT